MSKYDERLSALSKLNGATDEIAIATRELQDFKRGMRLLGMDVCGIDCIDRALDAMASTRQHIHVARCKLWGAVCDEMRGN